MTQWFPSGVFLFHFGSQLMPPVVSLFLFFLMPLALGLVHPWFLKFNLTLMGSFAEALRLLLHSRCHGDAVWLLGWETYSPA